MKLITFGFKYGLPPCNHFIDVSWIVNPFRHPEKDPSKLVLEYDGVKTMINIIVDYINHVHHRDRMIFGIGCSSGRDRSPIIAEEVSRLLKELNIDVELEHRDKLR
jgi:RNase adaptor protein for sRNA GlmZ degradation